MNGINKYHFIFSEVSLKLERLIPSNAYETELSVTDPTADQTITLPDATGPVSLRGDGNANDILSNTVFI